jgi:hypothetical protein
MTSVVDTSDVPTVAVRELALALKLLSASKAILLPIGSSSETEIRRVEQAFWQFSKRDRQRKVAVLLRFRCLLEACEAPRLKALLTAYGEHAAMQALAAAATMRLNAKWGFNPHKIARAVREAMSSGRPAESLTAAA